MMPEEMHGRAAIHLQSQLQHFASGPSSGAMGMLPSNLND
jgi:hypothetical protein